MKLEQSFDVTAPLDQVWAALIDVERVAPCLPGASVTGRNDDGSYDGTFKVKIGPTSAAYTGKLQMENIDAQAHTATMQAAGTDKRGQGGAKATIVSSVSEAGANVTKVDVATDYHITGRLARFGRGGMIEEISNRLLGEFATSLQQMLAGEAEVASDAAATSAEAPIVETGPVEAEAVGGAAGEAVSAEAVTAEAVTGEAVTAEAVTGEAVTAEAVTAEAVTAEAVTAEAVTGEGAAAEAVPAEAVAATGNGASAGVDAPETPASVTDPAARAEPEAVGTAEVLGTDPTGPQPHAPGNGTPSSALTAPSTLNQAPPPEAEPVQGLSLVASALWSQAKRNPIPLISALIGFLLALRIFRRRA